MDFNIKEEPDVIVLDEDDCPFTIVTVKIGENGAIEETNEPVINLDPEIHSTNNEQTDDSSETDNSDDWKDDTVSPADGAPLQPKSKRKISKDRRFVCQYCGLTFTQVHHLHDHVMTHTGEQPFKCLLCNKGFIQRSNLNRHIYHRHPFEAPRLIKDKMAQSYNCWDCKESFDTHSKYIKHMEFHRNSWTGKQSSSLQLAETSAINTCSDSDGQNDAAEIAYSCAFCDQEYPDEESLASHMRYHTGVQSPNAIICEDKPAQVLTEQHRKEQKQSTAGEFSAPQISKSFSCEYCGKECGTELKLSYHERTHRIMRTFRCSICRRGFDIRKKYDRHMKTHLTRATVQIEHQKGEETGDNSRSGKPFDCKYCGKQFSTKLSWSYHERTHRIQRKFCCSVCKRGFNMKQVYEEHVKLHLKEETAQNSAKEGPGSLNCRYCGKECTTEMNLSYHERTHKIKRSFHCVICRRGFNNEQAYTRHLQTHSGEEGELSTCKYCGKHCKSKLSLSYHERTHRIDRTFRCSICRRGFDSKLAYERHVRQHQRGEESVYYAKARPPTITSTVRRKRFSSPDRSLSEPERTPAVQMAFCCSVCKKGFNRRQTYERHIKIHSKILARQPVAKTEQLKDEESDIYSKQQSLESFMCIYCGKECSTKINLSYHERTHRIKRTFYCSVCKKGFNKRPLYVKHLKKHSSKPAVKMENEGGEGFSSHMDNYSEEANLRPFSCKECGATFTARQYLVRHVNSHSCGRFSCKFCGKKFTSKPAWVMHMRTHTVPYSCSMCNESFKIPGQLAVHMKILHGIKNSEPFSCSVCDCSCSSHDTLKLHMAQFHQELALEPFNDKDTEVRSSRIKTPFSCSVCKKGFDNRQTYVEHLKMHPLKTALQTEDYKEDGLISDMDNFSEEAHLKPFSCNECGERFSGKQYLARHMQTHTKLHFFCKFCDKKFTSKSSWIMHMRSHTVEMPYSCSICNEKFKIPGQLAVHMKSHGMNNSEPFSCSVCHNSFSCLDTLQLHMAQYHQKVAQELFNQGKQSLKSSRVPGARKAKSQFYCSVCKKGFNKRQAYGRHVRMHSSKPGNVQTEKTKDEMAQSFRCEDCGVHFSKQVSLDYHMRTHKIKYEFPCSMCNRKFSKKESYEEHMRMHAGQAASTSTSGQSSDEETGSKGGEIIFDCPLCDKEFTTPGELKAHLDEHEKKDLPKSYSCDKCAAGFAKKEQLESHMELHDVDKIKSLLNHQSNTAERPYSCTACKKTFDCQKKLEEHAETHTKPFSCAICRERCPSESALRAHMDCHGDDKLSFDCDDCGKHYSSKAGLFYHKISHNKKFRQTFRCSVCNAGFNRRLAYDWHVKMHCNKPTVKTEHPKGQESGEPSDSFSCEYCGAAFGESASLETHLRTHETNCSFSCSICGRGFKKKDVFELHVKTHEEESKTDLDNDEDSKG